MFFLGQRKANSIEKKGQNLPSIEIKVFLKKKLKNSSLKFRLLLSLFQCIDFVSPNGNKKKKKSLFFIVVLTLNCFQQRNYNTMLYIYRREEANKIKNCPLH